jgi:hypothetical protein
MAAACHKRAMPRRRKYRVKKYRVELEANDLGQVLEGLRAREESWRNTAIYLRDGYFPDDTFVCEECSDEHEAESIANFYKRIILSLERQRDKQDANPSISNRRLYLDGKSDGQLNLIARVESNWPQLRQLDQGKVRAELMLLTDQICDE